MLGQLAGRAQPIDADREGCFIAGPSGQQQRHPRGLVGAPDVRLPAAAQHLRGGEIGGGQRQFRTPDPAPDQTERHAEPALVDGAALTIDLGIEPLRGVGLQRSLEPAPQQIGRGGRGGRSIVDGPDWRDRRHESYVPAIYFCETSVRKNPPIATSAGTIAPVLARIAASHSDMPAISQPTARDTAPVPGRRANR